MAVMSDTGSVEIGQSFEGKYGFYCVDKATWIKIKYIRKYYQEALRRAHAWQRYYAKAKHNRKGSIPVLTPRDLVYCEYHQCRVYNRVPWFPKKTLWTQDNHENYLTVDIRIEEIYSKCRIPYKEKESAEKYSLTKVQLDSGHYCGIEYYVNIMYKKLLEASA